MSTTRTDSQDRFRFDRSDRIATQTLLWIGVAVTAIAPVLTAVDWFRRRQVVVNEVPVEVGEGAARAGRVVGPAFGDVLVQGVGAGQLMLLLSSGVLVVAAAVWGAILLGRVLGDLGRGEPFAQANVTRLRIVALLLLVVPLAADVLYGVARTQILASQGADSLWVNFQPGWILVGLLVAAVAQAFASGSRLRADVEGLV